jgi:hypothetical protein
MPVFGGNAVLQYICNISGYIFNDILIIHTYTEPNQPPGCPPHPGG